MVSQIKAWEPQAEGPQGFADESALVAGLRAADAAAFEALHAAYATSIYNLALRIVEDPHEAQDVAQEVLIKVLRGLPREEGDFVLPAWLYRVTVNASFDHLRARKRRPVEVADDPGRRSAAPVDEFERAELSRRVEATLRELPKRQQVALVLRDVHGLSVGETASALGVTRGSADVLLSRARAGFRKVFLTGAVAGRCVEADRILAAGVGGGVSAADSALLAEHTKTCPECRREVALWGAAPVGIGLLVPQVALPAKLSIGATLAAAQAAGVALPAGLGAAAAAGASAAGGSVAAGASAAAATGAAPAAAAGGAGVLAMLGSAAGVKVATLAAVATAAVGIAGVASRDRQSSDRQADVPVAMHRDEGTGNGSGVNVAAGVRERSRMLTQAHRGETPDAGGRGSGSPDARTFGHRGEQAGAASGTSGQGSGSGTGSGAHGGSAGAGGGEASGAGNQGSGGTVSGAGGGSISSGSSGSSGGAAGAGSSGTVAGGGSGQAGAGGGQSTGD